MTASETPLEAMVIRLRRSWRFWALIALLVILSVAGIAARVFGVFRTFKVPTGAMSPTISPGDRFIMDGATYLFRDPERAEVVVFDTANIESLPNDAGIYVMRIVGLPGETLRITEGKLYVNEAHVPIENDEGEIHYSNHEAASLLTSSDQTATVPAGRYFVLGDHTERSADSRFWGFVPGEDIMGRAYYRYWPNDRAGRIK